MCGIIVSETKIRDLKKGLEKIDKRGPDMTREISKNSALFMFNRLSIMGVDETGMQPFLYKGNVLVANGEIYNYKELKKMIPSYQYKGKSDCEVLLPLYDKIGTDMFELLDAEFAIVLYDEKTKSLIAGRDPIGIRPLFYGYANETNKIIFGSEVKAIIDFVKKVMPFPPGHYYKNGKFICYTDIYKRKNYHEDSYEDIIKNIKATFEEAVIKRLDSDAPIGFMLSGGLDSSLVCSIASKHLNSPIKTFCIGMEKDAIDLKYAKEVAKYIGSEHHEVIITKDEIINSLNEVIYSIESFDITTVRASIGMYLLAKHINENTDIKVLITGEVSDEIFGYKYTDYAPNEEEFQKEAEKRLKELFMYDVLRADRCLASNSLEARVPFGDLNFVNYVMRINPAYKMNKYDMGKYLLRKSFDGDYLPQNILYRDKAAFSDAVGHSLVDYLKEYSENYYTNTEFKEKQKLYSQPIIKTKEALLYMEIFLKHYPDHQHLIKDYWMPNKKWKHCDVNDPSARILANYGKSGE